MHNLGEFQQQKAHNDTKKEALQDKSLDPLITSVNHSLLDCTYEKNNKKTIKKGNFLK